MSAPYPSERERVEALRLLGLPRRARFDEVRRAYHSLARQLHPDLRHDADDREFAAITAAYAALRRYYRIGRTASDGPVPPVTRDERWWRTFGHKV
ncbi:MAG: J domain-containing protein [Chloroflexi bacterium]|nr:J domain-containing protein [Chloroflexota bacterium]